MAPDQYFQHTDGGFYKLKEISTSTVDQSKWVIYEHVWPFETKTWNRPLLEWSSRFTLVDVHEVIYAMLKDRVLAQAEIIHKRKARKAREGK